MANSDVTHSVPRPWKRALIWLAFLGPFFFISYGFANYLASQSDASHVVFEWEHAIPFIPWTILPYWSIDAFYGISFFLCLNQRELDRHAARLFSAQIIAVLVFIAYPMQFVFERPETSGLFGWLFASLESFDQPYNQAPSLHIALLIILWDLFRRHLPKSIHWFLHLYSLLIAVSVLTTYQHHFIDIPTGALLGWLCVWLWPFNDEFMLAKKVKVNNKQKRVALAYALSAIICFVLAYLLGGWLLWLAWPGVSLTLVALCYVRFGESGFQKLPDGSMNIASIWLFLPYLLGARINAYLWTRKQKPFDEIDSNVWIGRFPSAKQLRSDFHAVIDMTAEFVAPQEKPIWSSISNLDLLVPSEKNLRHAAGLIEQYRQQGKILVTCALGYSRSAMAIVTWLVISGRAQNIDQAITRLQAQRAMVKITESDKHQLRKFLQ